MMRFPSYKKSSYKKMLKVICSPHFPVVDFFIVIYSVFILSIFVIYLLCQQDKINRFLLPSKARSVSTVSDVCMSL